MQAFNLPPQTGDVFSQSPGWVGQVPAPGDRVGDGEAFRPLPQPVIKRSEQSVPVVKIVALYESVVDIYYPETFWSFQNVGLFRMHNKFSRFEKISEKDLPNRD